MKSTADKDAPEYREYVLEAMQHLGHAEGHTEFLYPDLSKAIRDVRKSMETCVFRPEKKRSR